MERVSELVLVWDAVAISVSTAVAAFASVALVIWAIGGSFSNDVSDYFVGYGIIQAITGLFGMIYFVFAPRIRIK